MAHTLMEMYEHDGKAVGLDAPVIQRVQVTEAGKHRGLP